MSVSMAAVGTRRVLLGKHADENIDDKDGGSSDRGGRNANIPKIITAF